MAKNVETKNVVNFSGFSTQRAPWSESDQTKIETAMSLALKNDITGAVKALSGLKGNLRGAKRRITNRIRAGHKSAF